MTDRGTRYLFITSEGLPATVFDSQVLEPLRDLAQDGLCFDLLAYKGARGILSGRRQERARIADVARSLSPGRVWLYRVPFFTRRLGTFAAAVLTVVHLAPSAARGQTCVCHCRERRPGVVGAWVKRVVPRCRIVYDMRSDISEEGAPGSAAYALLQRDEAMVVQSACRIICVSESMRRQVVARYPDVAAKISVIPCAASAKLFHFDSATRQQLRGQLGLDGRLVLVYCGGLAAPWHVADRLIASFRDLHEAHPATHLLLVTPDVPLAWGLASELGLGSGDVTVVHATHREVPGYLMAGDVGLLLRRRDSVNAVASPTKLAEYLMTGLPVVVSEGVGDSDALIASEGFGALVRDIGDSQAIDAAFRTVVSLPSADESRADRSARAAALLSSERYLLARIEVYSACERE